MIVKQKFIISIIFVLLVVGIAGTPAFAKEKNFFNERKTVLPANEKVDNVIVLGHDIDIKGNVDVSAIVINGNLKISKTARINGIVLVINGSVFQEPGSFVKENILAFQFSDQILNHLLIGAALLLGSWLIRFILSVSVILLSILIGLILKEKGERTFERIKGQTGKTILVGAITNFVIVGIIVLLMITVVGIPIAIILAIPPLMFFLVGLSMFGRMIGERIISKDGSSINWINTLAGSFILVSIFNFPFFGWIAMLCLFCLSTGLMVLWTREKWGKVKPKK